MSFVITSNEFEKIKKIYPIRYDKDDKKRCEELFK
jgi:hypothetical protein